jgi:MoxR-like ATPase
MNAQTSLENIYECTPRQVTEFVEDCIYAGLVPFVKSSPGMGKSSIMKNVADKLQLHMIDHRLSTSDPTDLNGLPGFVNGKAVFHPFQELFPLEDAPLVKDKQGWMLFLDEANSATKMVQAASYKLVLDRQVGQHNLHEFTAITMAGNHDSDGAIVNRLSTAMQSRVVHIRMRSDFKEWIEDVALPQDYDHRILAYLSWKTDALNDFKPDHTNDTFCCPRRA